MSKSIYTHKHHIIPRHAGGSDDPSNIKELTIEEHAEAHKKLFFIYGRWEDELAYNALNRTISGEEARIQRVKNSNLGKKHSEATKQKMREARLKNNPGAFSKGHTKSYDWTGKNHSPETIEKMSEARKKNNPGGFKPGNMYGRKHTEETKKKIKEARARQVMKPLSEEHKRKIGKANTGRKHTEETKKKLKEARARQVITDETRRKMSESTKLYYKTKRKEIDYGNNNNRRLHQL